MHESLVGRDDEDRDEQEGRQQSVDDGCPVKRLDRVDSGEVQTDAGCSGNKNQHVKRACLLQFLVQALMPSEGLRECVGSRSGQGRNGQKPDTDNSDRKQRGGKLACQRTKCLCGLARGFNVRDAVAVQSDCSGKKGLMVVPRIATSMDHSSRLRGSEGITLLRNT